jgi:hypothetical protein
MLLEKLEKVSENNLYKVASYYCPGMPFPSPLILLFRKKNNDHLAPTHLVNIYFLNYIYQIALPFNLSDQWMYDGIKNVTFHLAPPLIDQKWAEVYGFPTQHILDFAKNEIVKNEQQETFFTFDKSHVFQNEENKSNGENDF